MTDTRARLRLRIWQSTSTGPTVRKMLASIRKSPQSPRNAPCFAALDGLATPTKGTTATGQPRLIQSRFRWTSRPKPRSPAMRRNPCQIGVDQQDYAALRFGQPARHRRRFPAVATDGRNTAMKRGCRIYETVAEPASHQRGAARSAVHAACARNRASASARLSESPSL